MEFLSFAAQVVEEYLVNGVLDEMRTEPRLLSRLYVGGWNILGDEMG
jgi:hypothetical protein